jgi:hypothetical protein
MPFELIIFSTNLDPQISSILFFEAYPPQVYEKIFNGCCKRLRYTPPTRSRRIRRHAAHAAVGQTRCRPGQAVWARRGSHAAKPEPPLPAMKTSSALARS